MRAVALVEAIHPSVEGLDHMSSNDGASGRTTSHIVHTMPDTMRFTGAGEQSQCENTVTKWAHRYTLTIYMYILLISMKRKTGCLIHGA